MIFRSRRHRAAFVFQLVNRVVSGAAIFVNYAMQRVVRMSITYARRLSYCAGACQSISRARSLPSETDNGRCSASNAIRLCVARTYANACTRTRARARARTVHGLMRIFSRKIKLKRLYHYFNSKQCSSVCPARDHEKHVFFSIARATCVYNTG